MNTSAGQIINVAGLDQLIQALSSQGYRVIGPTVHDNAIVLDEIRSTDNLPSGWGVDVAPGHYRLQRRADTAMFAHSAGPGSWKQFMHPPHQKLLDSNANGEFIAPEQDATKLAFLGVRGCDLAAVNVLNKVLGSTARGPAFLIAVNCTEPGGLCFCTSMGTGPAVGPGYDLALTERIDDAGHWFLVEVGSARGENLLAAVPHRTAADNEASVAQAAVKAAAGRMGRAMPEVDLRTLLRESRSSAHWDDVAQRCLTCANCTMVCPTCFCTTTEDVTDLTGDNAERWQRWASCFELDFSYLHGGSVRTSAASRYRQWMTHKLSTWYDQFGTSGCVGCGRCIAWCPVGIDITEEAAKLAEYRSKSDATP